MSAKRIVKNMPPESEYGNTLRIFINEWGVKDSFILLPKGVEPSIQKAYGLKPYVYPNSTTVANI